ncbi:ABC transporter permease [Staphylococcus felis]|uniref:ABC transporter permease n=1 Tax=Staphylococcus felis TaxID=46127 RepID=UPI0039677910
MIRRTGKLVLYLLVSSFIIFCLVEHTSGNPAVLYLQRHGYTHITPEHIAMAQHELGLNRNVLLRYIDWVGHALTGDLGHSFTTNEHVTQLILNAITPTFILITCAALILLPLGYAIGYYAGVRPNAYHSRIIRSISQVMTSMPEYWLAIVFIYYLGVQWHVVPFVGSHSWQNFILPISVMVLVEGCHIILMTSHLIEKTLMSDTYQLALLRGFCLKDRIYVQIKEIFAPLMTISINSVIHLFGKAVILEVIFSMSGLGKLLINAMNQRDYPLIQGIVIVIIVIIMLMNYLGDMIILKSDPRVKTSRQMIKEKRRHHG